MFANDEGYLQIIELRGWNTRLLDDLEYAKGATLIDEVGKPLFDATRNDVKNSLKK